MRFGYTLGITLLGVVGASSIPALSAWGQAPTFSAPRTSKAVAIVQKALNELGTDAVLRSITDSEVTGSCTSAKSPGDTSNTFAWFTKGTESRFDTTTNGSTHSMRTGHGKPGVVSEQSGQSVSRSTTDAAQPYHVPGILLSREYDDQSISILYKGMAHLQQGDAEMVEITRFSIAGPIALSRQLWYFLESTGLPAAVDYVAPAGPSALVSNPIRMTYTQYSTTSSFMSPLSLSIETTRGVTLCSVTNVKINQSLSDTEFDPHGVGQ